MEEITPGYFELRISTWLNGKNRDEYLKNSVKIKNCIEYNMKYERRWGHKDATL